MQVSSKKLV